MVRSFDGGWHGWEVSHINLCSMVEYVQLLPALPMHFT